MVNGNMLLALLLSCFLRVSLQQTVDEQFPTYDIDWNVVPDSNGAFFQPTRDLTANCLCDLTEMVCDVNCCCDSDCDSATVKSFQQDKGCLPAGPPEQQLEYCQPKGEFARVNLPSGSSYYQIAKREADLEFLPQLLCIASDRNPNLGDQLADPPVGAVNAPILASACTPPATPTPSTSYSFDAAIPARRSIGGMTIGTTFTLPYPAFSSQCVDVEQVGYLVPMPTNPGAVYSECDRVFFEPSELRTQCSGGSALGANAYTSYALGQNPADNTYRIAVQVQEAQYWNQTTGVYSALATSSLPAPTWNGTHCSNVVSRVAFVMLYQNREIVAVQLSLVLTDVTAMDEGTPTVLRQRFRVQWVRQDVSLSLVRMFSGNPGYRKGLPVLAGVLTSQNAAASNSKMAVLRFLEGLPLLMAGRGGSCQAGLVDSVPFGANSSSSCFLPLTLLQLEALCTAGTNMPANLLGSFYTALVAQSLYLGIYGDADAEDKSQWVQVTASQPPSLQYAWNKDTSTCSNVFSGFEVQIVTGLTQAADNLQAKILYASVCFKFRDWKFYNPQTPNMTQDFVVQQSAVFVPKEQKERKKGRKGPPLMARLPEDLFYPFISSKARAAQPIGGVLLVAALAAAALLA